MQTWATDVISGPVMSYHRGKAYQMEDMKQKCFSFLQSIQSELAILHEKLYTDLFSQRLETFSWDIPPGNL